jgi:hypothetical protein
MNVCELFIIATLLGGIPVTLGWGVRPALSRVSRG